MKNENEAGENNAPKPMCVVTGPDAERLARAAEATGAEVVVVGGLRFVIDATRTVPACEGCGGVSKLRHSQAGVMACSEACERKAWRSGREREKFAVFDALVGPLLAEPFDAKKFKGRPESVGEVEGWRPTLHTPNLVLNGPTDRGKTRLAVMRLRESFARTGVLPEIVWPGDFASAVAEAWGEVEASKLKRKWGEVPVLLLDDVDKDKFTERAAEMLFAVLDMRLRHGRPTIMTLNMDGEEFLGKFPSRATGLAAVRRITAHGALVIP